MSWKFWQRNSAAEAEYRLPLKTVGWGPFPLPGERRRQEKSYQEARRLMALAEAADSRSEDSQS